MPLVVESFNEPSRQGLARRRLRSAAGLEVTFDDGSRALCGTSGLWNVNLGYGNRRVAEAIATACRDASYLTLFRYSNVYAERAAQALCEAVYPHRYSRVLYSTSASAALDATVKVVRHYWSVSGQGHRRLLVSMRGSYHGTTLGALALTGEDLGQQVYGADQRHVRHVSPQEPAEIGRLAERFGEQIAAVVVEPVLGSGAVEVDPGVIRAALALRRRFGTLVVADEVATGFGRTGPFLASHDWPEQPDLVVLSKALTNGTCAASAVLWAERVAQVYERADALLVHGETQAGTPPSCAAIDATLSEYALNGILERSRQVSSLLDRLLPEIFAKCPAVSGFRGRGCFRAILLAQPDGSPWSGEQVRALVELAIDHGAVLQPGPSCIQVVPALVYGQEALAELLGRAAAALERYTLSAARPSRP